MDERTRQQGTPQSVEKRSAYIDRTMQIAIQQNELRAAKKRLDDMSTFSISYGKKGRQNANELKAQKTKIQSIERELRSLNSAQTAYRQQMARISWA